MKRHDGAADGYETTPSGFPAPVKRKVGPQARKRIGTHLRAMYGSVLEQPVPDRFAELIARLGDEPSPRDMPAAGSALVRDPA